MDKKREETLDYVASVVKALITSRKPPVELKSILRDFGDVEGHPLAFHQLGFKTAQDMLVATKGFTFHNVWGEVCISAKYNPKTEHIASMVRHQKKSKSTSIVAPRQIIAPTKSNKRPITNLASKPKNIYYRSNDCLIPPPRKELQQLQRQQQEQQQQLEYKQQQYQEQLQTQCDISRNDLDLRNQLLRRQEERQAHLRQQFEEDRKRFELKLHERNQRLLKKEIEQQEEFQRQQLILAEKQRQVEQDAEREIALQSLTHRENLKERENLRILRQTLEAYQKRHQEEIEERKNKRMVDVGVNSFEEEILITINNSTKSLKEAEERFKQEIDKKNEQKRMVKLKEKNSDEHLSITIRNSPTGIQSRLLVPIEKKKLTAIENKPDQSKQMMNKPDQSKQMMNKPDQSKQSMMNSKMNGHKNTNQTMRPILGNSGSTTGPPSHRGKQSIVVNKSSGTSVNDRLKRYQIPTIPDTTNGGGNQQQQQKKQQIKDKTNKDETPPVLKCNEKFKFDKSVDSETNLINYCKAHGMDKPLFQTFGNRNMWHCSVRIGGNVYSSYPTEFPDEQAARLGTANIAIDRLTYLDSRKHLSICTMKDEEFLEILYQELLKYPHGILGHRLEQWYVETFKHLLPSHWYDLIKEFKKIRIEHGINPKIILFANPPGSPEHQPVSARNLLNKIPELPLPWLGDETASSSQDWSMHITHCDSTQHVWARLIDHNSSFEILIDHMKKDMAITSCRLGVPQPKLHEVYLVEVTEIWHRVRVVELDEEHETCRCHFVDFGDVVTFEYKDLYLCSPQFLVVPSQAVCLSMYALEKFEDHPYAYDVLCKELAGKTVVARILTTRNQFLQIGGQPQGIVEKGKRKACLVGTFYDTSTAEDIHLNDLVLKEITQSSRPPRLNLEQKSNPVLVSHINDMGDLMVLIPNEDLKFVERSIANTVSAGIDEQHRVQYTDLLRDNLVLVCDDSAGADGPKQWYRGMLTVKPKSPEEESFDIYYVDDGRLRKTHISNIYRLEANNLALAAFPPQALRVRLHYVPPMDAQMLGSLRGLIPPRSEVLLKVMESGVSDKLPMVIIYIRGQDRNSMYLCVNSAIRMEYEMTSNDRVDHFDDGGLHFNPNGQLLRRSSFSSIVSNHSSGSSSINNNAENISSIAAAAVTTPPVTPQKIVSIKDYEAIPAIGSYFEVRISLSINPARFAVQPYKCFNQLQSLMKDLQAYGKDVTATQSVKQCVIGQAYAAPDADNIYYRVTVQQIYDEIVHVRFVDLGDDGVLAKQQLKMLPMAMRELPKMAIPAQLYGIQLADIIWSKANCSRFRELTLGQKFIAIVRGYDKVKDKARVVSLELIDTSTPQDIKLHEILIAEKHAKPPAAS